MLRTGLIYGTISGLVLVVLGQGLMALSAGTAYEASELLGYATMLAALSMIFIGIRQHKQQQEPPGISFGQALQVGLIITLVASAFYVVGWMIYYHNGGGAEIMETYFQAQIDQIQQSDLSAVEQTEKLAEMDKWRTNYEKPLVMAGITFLEIFPIGLLVSLLAAWLLRTPGQERK